MRRLTKVALGVVLVLGLFVAAAFLGASSVRTWFDQNRQRVEAEQTADELDAQITAWEGEIARRTSPEAVRQAALCFGPYVEPGTEVYAVLGLTGCLAQPTPG